MSHTKKAKDTEKNRNKIAQANKDKMKAQRFIQQDLECQRFPRSIRQEVAEEMGLSPAQADRIKGANRLILPLRKMIEDGVGGIGLSNCQSIVKFSEAEQYDIYQIMCDLLEMGKSIELSIKILKRTNCEIITKKYSEGVRTAQEIWQLLELKGKEKKVPIKKSKPVATFPSNDEFESTHEKGRNYRDFCMDLLEQLGYYCEKTLDSKDHGGDIIAVKEWVRYVIQCKSGIIDINALREVYWAKSHKKYQADKALVICPRQKISNTLQTEATERGIQILFHEDLIAKCQCAR